MRIVAVTGLPGAGKSAVTQYFLARGFTNVYFGQPTFDRLAQEGLPVTEENERCAREAIRAEHGPAASAILSLPRIEAALADGKDVVLESFYSWEEYLLLEERFGDAFFVLAVYAPPRVRYERLAHRPERPLTPQQAKSRDYSQIENLHQAGPIAMADWTVMNTGTKEELSAQVERFFSWLDAQPQYQASMSTKTGA